MQVYQEHT